MSGHHRDVLHSHRAGDCQGVGASGARTIRADSHGDWTSGARTVVDPRAVPNNLQLSLDFTRIGRWVLGCCVLLEVAFVLLDYHVNYGRLTEVGAMRRLTNIAREDGLASWFGTTQTLLVGLTAWSILLLVRASHAPRWRRAGWVVVAAMFTYMAVDDGAQLHERLGTLSSALSERAGSSPLDLFPSYAWQILFVPLFGMFGIALAGFLWHELHDRIALILVGSAPPRLHGGSRVGLHRGSRSRPPVEPLHVGLSANEPLCIHNGAISPHALRHAGALFEIARRVSGDAGQHVSVGGVHPPPTLGCERRPRSPRNVTPSCSAPACPARP